MLTDSRQWETRPPPWDREITAETVRVERTLFLPALTQPYPILTIYISVLHSDADGNVLSLMVISCCLFWRCILNASAHELVCLCVFRETSEGIRQNEAQWWCLHGLDHLDAARCAHVALALDSVKRTLSSTSDVIWMSMVDFGLRLVLIVLESVCHALYMLSSIFVCLD